MLFDCDLCGVIFNHDTSPNTLVIKNKRIGRQYFLCPYCHNKILQFIDNFKEKEETEDKIQKFLLTKENLKYHCRKETAIAFDKILDKGYEIYMIYKNGEILDYEIKKKGE